jgi:hypothetical protein
VDGSAEVKEATAQPAECLGDNNGGLIDEGSEGMGSLCDASPNHHPIVLKKL